MTKQTKPKICRLSYSTLCHVANDGPTLDEQLLLGFLQKAATTAFEVVYGWSLAGTIFYDVRITTRRRQSD